MNYLNGMQDFFQEEKLVFKHFFLGGFILKTSKGSKQIFRTSLKTCYGKTLKVKIVIVNQIQQMTIFLFLLPKPFKN